jgi:ribosomal protein S12 methylthiotransferase
MRVHLLTLGCAKNTADSGRLLERLTAQGARHAPAADEADLLIVNTCGFIEEAKRESIDEILRLAASKSAGQRLVVMGCLAQRYARELARELPEVDAFFGVGEEEALASYAGANGSPSSEEPASNPLFPRTAVPLKVAEGCDRRCTFCVIPSIRGPFRSREPDALLGEAEKHIENGARELMLVAQDLTSYGRDIPGYGGIARLIREMASLAGDFWLRPLYLHPAGVTDDLLDALGEEKVCPYVDIPLQHSERAILLAMGRGGDAVAHRALLGRIREALPGAVLRTTLIVGFPGERERDFEGLLRFVREARFDRLGAFAYSREEGTPAAGLKGRVAKRAKEARLDALMDAQASISLEHNRALVGARERVLIEEVGRDGTAMGRTRGQAPEVDGVTFVTGAGLREGEFVDVTVTGASHYDLEVKAR